MLSWHLGDLLSFFILRIFAGLAPDRAAQTFDGSLVHDARVFIEHSDEY